MDNVSVWGFSNRSSSLVFKDMSKELDSKVDKYGSEMHGDLNMNGNGILNIREPTNVSDCVTKKYYDESIGLLRSGVISLRNNTVNDIERIDRVTDNLGSRLQSLHDRVSNLDEKINTTLVDIIPLLRVADTLLVLKLVNKWEPLFSLKYKQVRALYNVVIFEFPNELILKEFKNQKFVEDLNNLILRVILYLSEDDFIRLKGNLSLPVIENGSVAKKYHRIVNKLAGVINPDRSNREVSLLTQKNLTLIQLGYIFIHDGLLSVADNN